MTAPKIAFIGVGSANFGPTTLATLIREPKLRGAELALIDLNGEALESVRLVAERMNEAWEAEMTIRASTDRRDLLPGCDFVILSVEVPPREELWRLDYEITLRHDLRQPFAENGGPGGLLHTCRQVPPIMAIVADMEAMCPDAWLINFSNPLPRLTRAITKYSGIKAVGKCHQINVAYGIVAVLLRERYGIDVPPDLHLHSDPSNAPTVMQYNALGRRYTKIKSAGLNHFIWLLDARDRVSGEDLYPALRQALADVPPDFEPLSMDLFRVFDLCPIPGDTHLAEYLPWLHDPIARPWERYDIPLLNWGENEMTRVFLAQMMQQMASGEIHVNGMREATSEGAVELITAIFFNEDRYEETVNIPNYGAIPGLPDETIVELPALVNGLGIQGMRFEPLPAPVTELLRREAALVEMVVDTAVCGDRDLALQTLLLDPMINDIDRARAILDDYLGAFAAYLPQFA
ncbi:MAG: hypothetical protein ACK2UK_00685 [Candidatus Promineifilaceae bacterium]